MCNKRLGGGGVGGGLWGGGTMWGVPRTDTAPLLRDGIGGLAQASEKASTTLRLADRVADTVSVGLELSNGACNSTKGRK